MSCLVVYYYRAVFWGRAFQYLILVLITTDPGLRLSRMTTITNYPSSRSRIVAHTARRHPVVFLCRVYIIGFRIYFLGFCRCCLVVIHKGVVFVFFFVKMQTLSIGCTRMCALYKNVYKRPFCSNIKKSKKEEV